MMGRGLAPAVLLLSRPAGQAHLNLTIGALLAVDVRYREGAGGQGTAVRVSASEPGRLYRGSQISQVA